MPPLILTGRRTVSGGPRRLFADRTRAAARGIRTHEVSGASVHRSNAPSPTLQRGPATRRVSLSARTRGVSICAAGQRARFLHLSKGGHQGPPIDSAPLRAPIDSQARQWPGATQYSHAEYQTWYREGRPRCCWAPGAPENGASVRLARVTVSPPSAAPATPVSSGSRL